jgi:uncharacterized protein (DUF1684 family)
MRKMTAASIVVMTIMAAACAKDSPVPADYREQVLAFREKRAREIIAPTGWAALVGLHFLIPGTHTVGRTPGSGVQLTGPSAPPVLGTVIVGTSSVRLQISKDVTVRRGDQIVTDVDLQPSSRPEDLLVAGAMTLTLIKRGNKLALRIWDTQAPTLTGLPGLEWMPMDEAWRVPARFEPHPPGRTMKILNVLDELVDMPNPGVAVFRIGGREYRLEAVLESDDAKELFFLFRDGTSGKTTYGAGRYLYSPLPERGRVILDFNQAKNPPCTFTDFATCPLPPKGNVLAVAVQAGELDRPHR